MKLPRLIALHYGLAAILMASSMTISAEVLKEAVKPKETVKKEMIEAQQKETEATIKATEKAVPDTEARPATTTSHKEHSVQSSKGEMIKSQKKATEQGVEDAEAAKPAVETRPAVTTKKTSNPPS
jgi:hypothetical protein